MRTNGNIPIIIIADLTGGTPCNVAMMAIDNYPQLRVISGLNLPILIEAAVTEIEKVDELAVYLLGIGQQSGNIIEVPKDNEEIDGFEE